MRCELTRIFILVAPTLGTSWLMSIVIVEFSAVIVPAIFTVLVAPPSPARRKRPRKRTAK